VPEPNVLESLRKLVELQKFDNEIFMLNRELEEKPAVLDVLKQEFEAKKGKLKELEDRFKGVQVERNTLEGDLASKEENIKKADMQLTQLKTNKEYHAKITEIEGLKAAKSMIEEKILISYDKTDEVKALVESEKKVVAQQEQDFQARKKLVENEIKAIQDRVVALKAEREKLLPGFDKGMLSRYERILNNRDGLAVVPVKHQVCGGCFMNVPAQVINEVKKHEEMIICEICARILYLEEELGL